MSDWPEGSTGRAMEDLREACAKLRDEVLAMIRKDWPQLILIYLGVIFIVALVSLLLTFG